MVCHYTSEIEWNISVLFAVVVISALGVSDWFFNALVQYVIGIIKYYIHVVGTFLCTCIYITIFVIYQSAD